VFSLLLMLPAVLILCWPTCSLQSRVRGVTAVGSMSAKTLGMKAQAPVSNTTEAASGNSHAELRTRVAWGQITYLGPLLVTSSRTVFLIAAQALVAGIFVLIGNPSPWRSAAPWWSVYGTLADLGCLALMMHFTRKEGLSLRDLIGRINWRWDFLLAAAFLVIIFACFTVAARPSTLIAYGPHPPDLYHLYPGMVTARQLPVWAIVYSCSIFLMIWSPTEELTYQGYALPRLHALSRRRWVAVLLVSFWFALQHSFLPVMWDWHYIVYRFLAFWPPMAAVTLLYLWIRRLPPLILTHWAMDVFALYLTLRI
jgi:hypothetical protein